MRFLYRTSFSCSNSFTFLYFSNFLIFQLYTFTYLFQVLVSLRLVNSRRCFSVSSSSLGSCSPIIVVPHYGFLKVIPLFISPSSQFTFFSYHLLFMSPFISPSVVSPSISSLPTISPNAISFTCTVPFPHVPSNSFPEIKFFLL